MMRSRYQMRLLGVWGLIGIGLVVGNIFTTSASENLIPTNWFIEEIDDVDDGMYVHYSYTDTAIDEKGNAHVCYRGDSRDLRYATKSNNLWTTEIVKDLSINVARECAITLDAAGLPHISYSYDDGSGENLFHAYKDVAGEWHNEFVDGVSNDSVGMESDIAIDENGHIHISHYEWSGNNLQYSVKENDEWQTELIIEDNVAWDKTSIAIDNQQYVHIVFNADNQIKHISGQYDNWSEPEIIAPCPHTNCGTSLAIDTKDNLHVTFGVDSEKQLQYATNQSGEWETVAVATNVQVSEHHSIAVDKHDSVHISYFDAIKRDLLYANNTSGQWSSVTVDSEGDVGLSNSIAVDKYNHVKVCYRDDMNIITSYGAWGLSSNNIYAVGQGSVVLHFNGNTWQQIPIDVSATLNDIWGSSASNIYAVGQDGTLIHYDGNNWAAVASGVTEHLKGIWGSSASNIYVVGGSGTVLHFDGLAWVPINIGTTNPLNDVWGSSSNDIFIVGGVGGGEYISHYDGNNWSDMNAIDASALEAVWGSSATNVYAVGLGGTMVHYDGGAWQTLEKETANTLYDLWGSSTNDIFAVGNNGVILHYDGVSWSTMTSGTGEARHTIWGSSATDVYTLGHEGLILHYGGKNWESMLQPKLKCASQPYHIYLPLIKHD